MGIADRVVPDADLAAEAAADAARWAAGPTRAYAAAKRALAEGRAMPLDEALALEQAEFNALFATADAKAGVLAFVDKHEPEFRGR
jgi:2-(1,2-epoxy-1,2-dihydrophenyl)acetyl-CoA isomerase